MHPRHMTDSELAQAYDEVIFSGNKYHKSDKRVIAEHNRRIAVIKSTK